MCEPRFKIGEKAKFKTSIDTYTVAIQSEALRYVKKGDACNHVYLVRHVEPGLPEHPFLASSRGLTRVEQWEPCPGRHRAKIGGIHHHPDGAEGPWERLVE